MTRPTFPGVILPTPPDATRLWLALLTLAWFFVAWWGVDRLAGLMMDYWLLESLGLELVFWTNFKVQAALFVVAIVSNAVVVVPPAPAAWKRVAWHLALMEGVFSGAWLAGHYQQFLSSLGAQPFGEVDPIFGNDIGFYAFVLPGMWVVVYFLWHTTALAAVSGALAAWGRRPPGDDGTGRTRLVQAVAVMATPWTLAWIAVNGWVSAYGWWIARYDLLIKDNADSSIYAGAAYVDVTGVFSSLVDYYMTGAVVIVGGGLFVAALARIHRNQPSLRLWQAVGVILVADFCFKGAVAIRQDVFVTPNEPVVQLPYIERHVDATRRAYALDRIETVPFVPRDVGDPLPDVNDLLADPVLRNAPLWPGFASYLEELIDLQHTRRILQTGGDPMVYGPTLEIFRQEQKLRAYYDFLDVDTIRLPVDGESRMFVSAVREVPLNEPEPWLAWWGQRFMLFTHGYGLVTASTAGVSAEGEPVYTSSGIPAETSIPGLQAQNQAVYYGEGAGSMAYTNVRDMMELDFPTDEGRAEVVLPPDVDAGVPLDSLLKRLVFGWRSGQFIEIVFSGLISSETRVHYFRTPLERVEKVAPFLYWDTDPFAVVADGRIVWMVNGISWTDRYPYSAVGGLGDKSDERSPTRRPIQPVNYARDGVKATVDAYTGRVTLYDISGDPIVATWSAVYPGLIQPGDNMPPEIEAQIQYPVQLFHLQFDNLYNIYQMEDPMTFFNMEDMWDDGDEVMGPILDSGHAIRFSIEPFHVMLATGDGILPRAEPATQFSLGMVFTPESALNLRAIPIVFQDGDSYGRIISLQVPKGHFFTSPEQADAAIDQDPAISQQITWWNRMGAEVIRGHTSTLIVGNDVLYVEPIFLRSEQNPVTQLKRVCVVFRGKAVMAESLEEAVRLAVAAHDTVVADAVLEPAASSDPIAPGTP